MISHIKFDALIGRTQLDMSIRFFSSCTSLLRTLVHSFGEHLALLSNIQVQQHLHLKKHQNNSLKNHKAEKSSCGHEIGEIKGLSNIGFILIYKKNACFCEKSFDFQFV